MDASGSIPLPPMPLKKTGESIIAAAPIGRCLDWLAGEPSLIMSAFNHCRHAIQRAADAAT
jgi:hypothetical protein